MTEPLWTEELVRLPESAWCYAPPLESVAMRRAERAEGAPIVFGCFNVVSKVNAQVVECWSRILRGVPGSRLLMKSWASDSGSLDIMHERFAAHGIERERLDMRGREESFTGHLALYGQMDIALDPFPYAGTTTTCEAMWMGVPVVTLAGRTHAGRVGVSLLNSVELPELVGESVEDYVEIAVALARDEARARLRELQGSLRERMKSSSLMDSGGFTRKLEAAYHQIWRRYCTSSG
jgi:predicted O-linked N-acetylglucosamine transferase (SPINDLY family)